MERISEGENRGQGGYSPQLFQVEGLIPLTDLVIVHQI